uniref:BAG family molecular chaperone regulator 2 n=1 Tax=Acrobeloides nanus TaxID=290746 RepID=A0A914CGM3_9BILA
LLINADRILNRCKAVDVVVSTPRNEHQAKALEEVNILLQGVISKMQEDLNNSKETVKRYLNACSPDQPDGPIDQKFQAKIIECTADDQKKIRRKLAQIITQIERAEQIGPTLLNLSVRMVGFFIHCTMELNFFEPSRGTDLI